MKKEEIKIGFTGTQIGMTDEQKAGVNNYLVRQVTRRNKKITEVHHGDCVGADHDFHDICSKRKIAIHIHPPINSNKRSYCVGNKTYPVKDYLDRNHDIVESTDFLIATPKEYDEQLRSGTWATVRYAMKNKKKVVIIYPDGMVEINKTWGKSNEKESIEP